MKITKAVIPCGGMGTRFFPITKAVPKELLPVIDTPVLSYIIEEAADSGITDVLLILGQGKEAIRTYFSPSEQLYEQFIKLGKEDLAEQLRKITERVSISFGYQDEPRGSADAVYKAKDFVGDQPFCLAWGDDIIFGKPVMGQLIDVFNAIGENIVGVQQLLTDDITKYGVAKIREDTGNAEAMLGGLFLLDGFIEKPNLDRLPSRFAAMGRYLLTADVFAEIENTQPGKNGEYQLTDTINSMCLKSKVYAYNFDGKRHDMGDRLGALKATVEVGLEREFGNEFREYLKKLIFSSEQK